MSDVPPSEPTASGWGAMNTSRNVDPALFALAERAHDALIRGIEETPATVLAVNVLRLFMDILESPETESGEPNELAALRYRIRRAQELVGSGEAYTLKQMTDILTGEA